MSENFITKIFVEKSIKIKDFEIKLSEDHRQHLIITGKMEVAKQVCCWN